MVMTQRQDINTRHQARILVLQTLFEIDFTRQDFQQVWSRNATKFSLSRENREFALTLLKGVTENRKAIDGLIRKAAPSWPLKQMARIDKNILRLAIFEMFFARAVPVGVAINEAVELAKNFGSESSPKFVNGVLGTIADWLEIKEP